MKNYYLTLLLLCLSCKKKSSYSNEKISNEKLDTVEVVKKDSIINDSIKQLKAYESLIINEVNKSPDSIIYDYLNFTTNYPNSFWKEDIIERISNVDSIRKFWSKEDGWKLLNIKPTKDMQDINCPSSFNF